MERIFWSWGFEASFYGGNGLDDEGFWGEILRIMDLIRESYLQLNSTFVEPLNPFKIFVH